MKTISLFKISLSLICSVCALLSNEQDTTFLQRDTINGRVQSIYIDYDKKSKSYKGILPPRSAAYSDNYGNSLQYLRERNLLLSSSKPIIPWKSWVPLYQYKDNYYVYNPCDGLFLFGQSINDTTFID